MKRALQWAHYISHIFSLVVVCITDFFVLLLTIAIMLFFSYMLTLALTTIWSIFQPSFYYIVAIIFLLSFFITVDPLQKGFLLLYLWKRNKQIHFRRTRMNELPHFIERVSARLNAVQGEISQLRAKITALEKEAKKEGQLLVTHKAIAKWPEPQFKQWLFTVLEQDGYHIQLPQKPQEGGEEWQLQKNQQRVILFVKWSEKRLDVKDVQQACEGKKRNPGTEYWLVSNRSWKSGVRETALKSGIRLVPLSDLLSSYQGYQVHLQLVEPRKKLQSLLPEQQQLETQLNTLNWELEILSEDTDLSPHRRATYKELLRLWLYWLQFNLPRITHIQKWGIKEIRLGRVYLVKCFADFMLFRSPDSAHGRILLALLSLYQGKYSTAIQQIIETLHNPMKPRESEKMYELALFVLQDLRKQAREKYREARLYRAQGQIESAFKNLRSAISLEPRIQYKALNDPAFSSLRHTQAFRRVLNEGRMDWCQFMENYLWGKKEV